MQFIGTGREFHHTSDNLFFFSLPILSCVEAAVVVMLRLVQFSGKLGKAYPTH
jgi:hypothetical protein